MSYAREAANRIANSLGYQSTWDPTPIELVVNEVLEHAAQRIDKEAESPEHAAEIVRALASPPSTRRLP